ncbi:Farnesyl pyrophosphate synthase [Holothuria leucospilota]|uniref:Farnesyl pyrophosphate synthase n=1 Tax=Holothuria leucospilota TaxID=206669 RepID=A0A9Q1CMU4_HOLLE|nr:Farnesyl pyrophosphate synthase [Holothuria leucospilota]
MNSCRVLCRHIRSLTVPATTGKKSHCFATLRSVSVLKGHCHHRKRILNSGWEGVNGISKVTVTTEGRSCEGMALDAKKDAQKFGELFERLVEDLTADDAANPEITEAANRFKEVLRYNVPHGKRNRGLSVVSSFRYLANSSQLTESNLNKAMVLGWCVELLQSYFLIADDMMDQSKTRRGQQCWYLKVKGNDAINDSFYVEASIYKLLKKYFREEPYYVNLLELFHETNYQTIVGQALDLLSTSSEYGNVLDRFTQERYDAIVKWKTAFYSFYLPVALAMYMAGNSDPEAHKSAKIILLKMGHFFQVQDDFLDCYGDPAVIGKIGTDIEEHKCGWLVVQALKVVTPEQRKILEDNYGVDDKAKVSAVKQLYKDLNLESVFYKYEEESYEDLMKLIDVHSKNLPKEMFVAYAKRIFKRKK